ncbi:(2Fe-2S)-binding protein [Streptomyces hirsutus]
MPRRIVTAALHDVANMAASSSCTSVAGTKMVTGHYYAQGFTDVADAIARRHDAREPRIDVSIAHLGHAARLWSPALACVLLHGIVPDLSGLQRADEGPALRLPRPSGHRADRLPDPAGALYEQVMNHLRTLAAGLRVKIAPRLLDGKPASALAGAARAC